MQASQQRHGQVLLESAGLLLCYGAVGLLTHWISPWHLVPSVVLLLFLGAVPQGTFATGLARISLIRVPIIAALNYGLCYAVIDNTRELRLVLSAWCALAMMELIFASKDRRPLLLNWQPHTWLATARLRFIAGRLILPVIVGWLFAITLHHWMYPESVVARPVKNVSGPVHLRIKLPGTSAGIPEPLIVCGVPGKASMIYIRILNQNRARIGIEFWGLELDQGPEFALPAADAELAVTCEMPALFLPAEADSTDETLRNQARRFRVTVNGAIRLDGTVDYVQPRHSPLYFGINPLGGSFISSKFTGTILQVSQGK